MIQSTIQFRQHTLPNGLTIIGEANPTAHTAAVGFFVRTGSRDESPDLMGVSHFLEHMMFKGTARRSAAQVNIDFDRIGANYNAFTTQETTAYYAHVLPEFLPDAIDLLADILRPALRTGDFDMEKNVILEEIGMYADRPFWVIYEEAMARFYDQHPLALRILGTNASIAAMSRDAMLNYFNHRYSPDNTVVSLAGRFDFDTAIRLLESATAAWAPTRVQRTYPPLAPKASDLALTKPSVNMHYLVGVSAGPSAQSPLHHAAAVLASILGDSEGSRLYWKLIDPGLAEEAEVSYHGFDQTGSFMFYTSCDPQHAPQVESIMNQVLDAAADNLTEDELQRAVSKLAMDLTLQNERPAGRMMALGGHWLYQPTYLTLEEELAKFHAVTPATLRDLLTQFPLTPRSTVRMSPGDAQVPQSDA
jgi:predicted Zn-dependent peptidase